MKYTLVAVGENIAAFPYLFKLSLILRAEGSLEYIYWDRFEGEHIKLNDIVYNPVLKITPVNRWSLMLGYLKWFFALILSLSSRNPKERVYFVSRLDAAAAIWVLRLIGKKFKYIYLDRDAYHMTYKLGLFKPIVKAFETLIAKHAHFHFIPGKSRDFTNYNNVVSIENTPSRKVYEDAKNAGLALLRDERFTVYINGWLVETRGAEFILSAVKELSQDQFKVIVAGPPHCEAIRELLGLDIVEYLGQLDNTASLSYYFVSDVVLSFYDPSIEVNRKAEPNKWYDCAFCGVPFITNTCIETSEPFEKIGLAHLIPYGSKNLLLEKLHNLKNSADKRGTFESRFSEEMGITFWDDKVREVVKSING